VKNAIKKQLEAKKILDKTVKKSTLDSNILKNLQVKDTLALDLVRQARRGKLGHDPLPNLKINQNEKSLRATSQVQP